MNSLLFLSFWLGAFSTQGALAAEVPPAPKPVDCLAPESGPMWLQDFTEEQKRPLKITWEADEKGGRAVYRVRGEYPEAVDNERPYLKFKHQSEIDAREQWVCGADRVSKFESIRGEVETTLEWRRREGSTEETFESENRFEILGPDVYRHVAHESEGVVKVESVELERVTESSSQWKQTWDEMGVPRIRGKTREEMEEKVFEASAQTRSLASAVTVPGFEPSPLPPGQALQVNKEVEGKLDGPIDPVELVTTTKVEQVKGGKRVEWREIQSRQETRYHYSPTAKGYQFQESNELYDETTTSPDRGVKSRLVRWDTWNDPEKAPSASSFWKETLRRSKFSGSTELTFSSQGHGLLPSLFGYEAKEGNYSRITDYNAAGKIVRFLVMLFPKGAKENETLMDLQFTESGSMKEFLVQDAEIKGYENPFGNPKALQALQNRIHGLRKLEHLELEGRLPKREVRDGDYPVVYSVVP